MERSRLSHTVPYDDLYGSLSLFAWLLAATYLGLELFHRQRAVGAFVLPVVLIVLFVSAQAGHAVASDAASRARAVAGAAHHAERAGVCGVCACLLCLA